MPNRPDLEADLAPGLEASAPQNRPGLARASRCAYLAAVSCEGEDAAAFLDAQLTSAVADLEPGAAAASAWCNPKGRVVATFHVVRDDARRFLLILDKTLAEPVVERLRRFVLRARVAFTVLENAAVGGCLEPAQLPQAARGQRIERGRARALNERLAVANVGLYADRYLLLAAHGDLPLADPDAGRGWRIGECLDGVAHVVDRTSELFLPQAVNLDLTGGLSFRKGCYPGQEIVARLRYLGRLKSRMVGFRAQRAAPPAPGDALFQAGRKVGQVVAAAPTDEPGRILGLASVHFIDLDWSGLTLADGAAALVHLPPYEIPELAAS